MKWTEESIKELIQYITNGYTYDEIANIFETTNQSIRSKCFRLGIKSSDYKETKIFFCLNCQTEIISDRDERKFCSKSCSASFNNKKKKKKIKNCVCCDKNLEGRQKKYCSDKCQCDYEYNEYIKRWKNGEENGISGSGLSTYIRKYLFKKYNSKCTECGWNKINPYTNKIPLQVEHKDGNSKNNLEENLDLLCPSCHSLTKTFGSLNNGNGRSERQRYRNQLKKLTYENLIQEYNASFA